MSNMNTSRIPFWELCPLDGWGVEFELWDGQVREECPVCLQFEQEICLAFALL